MFRAFEDEEDDGLLSFLSLDCQKPLYIYQVLVLLLHHFVFPILKMMANSSEEEIDIGGYDEEPEAQSMELQAENYIGQQDSDVDITQNDEDRQETESGDDDEVEGVYDASNASEGSSEDEDSREHENNEVGIVFDREKDEEDEELLALPPHGTQIFIANLSREVTEEDLRNLCRVCGEVVDITIDWEENTQRTHAFVTFTSKRVADRAIRELNGRVCKDREIRVLKHQAKNRLFLGNIPSHLKEEDVAKRVSEQGPGFEHIQLIKGADDSSRNRRFGFADYYNHACAEKSMKNMIRSQFMLEGKVITVQWAKNNGSSERMKQVHVSNLPENVTEEQMRELFSPHGEITKVLLFPLKNYGFVHFAEHPSALKAIDKSEKYVIEGHELIASMARQKGERKPPSQQSMGHYSYPSRIPNYTHYGQSQQSMGHYSYPSQMPNYPYYVYGANNAYESTRLDNGRTAYMLQSPTNLMGAFAAPFISPGSASYGTISNSNRSSGGIRSDYSPTERNYSIRSSGERRSYNRLDQRNYSIRSSGDRRSQGSPAQRNYSIRSSGDRRSLYSPAQRNYSIRSSGDRRSHYSPAQRDYSIRANGERRSHYSPAETNYSIRSIGERRSHCNPTERSSRNYGSRKSGRNDERPSRSRRFGPY
ncbi:heterogeneous nuclear ribonucleoprotein Q-like [Cryptomeria japonica]|uniref:heterogeneous nuclear ribonucleoprotein Q-like n=1 Tax=Cryptomeria japonica TaxID=3369 RepID=UPI0027DA9C7A|nr:heterogeneous nuclear ribonucleoprotein Q-like [Cryptomeria japonica]